MGKARGRSHRDTDELKRLAHEFKEGGLSDKGVLDHINELDQVGESPVAPRTLRRWLSEFGDVPKDAVVRVTYNDVMYLRQRAFLATALCEVNRSYIIERAYWWGLYISALHIMLRQALAVDAAAELPPQFIMDNLEKFYADIRKIQQMTPPLDLGEGGEETVEELNARMRRFEEKYAKKLKLPRETL